LATETYTISFAILGIGSTQVSPKDSMVMEYVPAGEFLMGASNHDTNANSR